MIMQISTTFKTFLNSLDLNQTVNLTYEMD